MLALLFHSFLASAALNPAGAGDTLGIGSTIGGPLLTGAQFLIPAGVAFAGLHKVLNHQETGGGFLVDMIAKGGGAILVIQVIKALVPGLG